MIFLVLKRDLAGNILRETFCGIQTVLFSEAKKVFPRGNPREQVHHIPHQTHNLITHRIIRSMNKRMQSQSIILFNSYDAITGHK